MTTLETFKWCVRPDLTVSNEPNVVKLEFGDGYTQRARKGIHNLLRKYSVVVKVKNKNRLAVDNFLSKHGGVDPFYYLDPYTGQKKKVVCAKYPAKMGKTYTEFTCEFEEVP